MGKREDAVLAEIRKEKEDDIRVRIKSCLDCIADNERAIAECEEDIKGRREQITYLEEVDIDKYEILLVKLPGVWSSTNYRYCIKEPEITKVHLNVSSTGVYADQCINP